MTRSALLYALLLTASCGIVDEVKEDNTRKDHDPHPILGDIECKTSGECPDGWYCYLGQASDCDPAAPDGCVVEKVGDGLCHPRCSSVDDCVGTEQCIDTTLYQGDVVLFDGALCMQAEAKPIPLPCGDLIAICNVVAERFGFSTGTPVIVTDPVVPSCQWAECECDVGETFREDFDFNACVPNSCPALTDPKGGTWVKGYDGCPLVQ